MSHLHGLGLQSLDHGAVWSHETVWLPILQYIFDYKTHNYKKNIGFLIVSGEIEVNSF